LRSLFEPTTICRFVSLGRKRKDEQAAEEVEPVARRNAKKVAKAPATAPRKPLKPGPDGIVRLSGGNPQIAKGYGEAPVRAYIAAMPGWTRAVGRQLDSIITRVVPGVRKAVKWNSPLYGVEEGVWFLSIHVYARYIKVTFFSGGSLRPQPSGKSKYARVRHYDIREGEFDPAQFADWVKQASKLPGEKM
jgi:hypothetical protein